MIDFVLRQDKNDCSMQVINYAITFTISGAAHLGPEPAASPAPPLHHTGGGISPDGTCWISCGQDFFLPVRVLSRLFRPLFVDELRA
jgi:hypothetical protein